MGDFEDYDPSEDEWDEWDMGVEEAYEEAGDDDFEDSSWKDLLRSARDKENDLPEANDTYDDPGDSDFEDFSWKELLAKGTNKNEDLPSDDTESHLSENGGEDDTMNQNEDLSGDDEDPPEMHKLAKAMMQQRGSSPISDLPE